VLEWHERLIALRRSNRWFSNGDRRHLDVQFDEEAGWFVMSRGPMTVACNFSQENRCMPVAAGSRVLLSSEAGAEINECGVRLPGESLAVLELAG
jgi:maltooligosyltrehalose trehalohydrolase